MTPAREALDQAASALQDALTLDVGPEVRARLVACYRELARAEGALEEGALAGRVAAVETCLADLVEALESTLGELGVEPPSPPP